MMPRLSTILFWGAVLGTVIYMAKHPESGHSAANIVGGLGSWFGSFFGNL
jgi:hypothetical protein